MTVKNLRFSIINVKCFEKNEAPCPDTYIGQCVTLLSDTRVRNSRVPHATAEVGIRKSQSCAVWLVERS